jgi:hypothetical protein
MATVTTLRANRMLLSNDIVNGPGGQQTLCEAPWGNVVELLEAAVSSP